MRETGFRSNVLDVEVISPTKQSAALQKLNSSVFFSVLIIIFQDDVTLNFHAGRSLDSFCEWQAAINIPINETNEFGLGHHDNAVLVTR